MLDNYSINSIQSPSLKKKEDFQGLGAIDSVKTGMQPQSVQPGIGISHRGDSISFSDEIGDVSQLETGNLDALKNEIYNIKNQLNVAPSGKDVSADLVDSAMAVNMERNGLQGAKAETSHLGMTPGLHDGGTIGAGGIQSGFDAGMKPGGVFSSRYSPMLGHEAGGGLTTPKMAKLQTDYAGALKLGHMVSPEADNMVLSTFANQGKTAAPIRTMLGMENTFA